MKESQKMSWIAVFIIYSGMIAALAPSMWFVALISFLAAAILAFKPEKKKEADSR